MNGQYDLEVARPMAYSDIPQVVEIEQQVTFHPWTQNAFSESIKAGDKCWVIEYDNQVVAYLFQSIYTEESHILNLAVKSTRQGQGLGRGLVKKACADASRNGVITILLEVCPNNLTARQLYESERFLVLGRRNNYYRSGSRSEDALVMKRVLKHSSVITQ